MPEKKSFILYIDRKKELDLLTAEQCGILFKAIFDYVDSGSIVDIDDIAIKLMFSVFKSQIDENSAKWEECKKKRSEAGKKGGAPKGNKNASKQANQAKQAKTNNDCLKQANQAKQAVTVTDTVTDTVVSVTNVTDTLSQPCTAAGAAAQADSENSIRYSRIIGESQTIIDEDGYEVIPIDPNDDTWA